MLKPLATLIKLNKSQLDEKRKELSVLLDKKQGMLMEIKKVEDSIKYEAENLMQTQEEFRPMFLVFLTGCRQKEAIILEDIDKINPQINKMTDEIARIFSEMKKYEILKENIEARILEEISRKEQIEIDEMAIMSHVRKTGEEYFS